MKNKKSQQSHKQMELFTTAASAPSHLNMDDMEFQTFRIEKISMSSTPMSFDLAVEVLSKAFNR
ncbi:MAG: hypothetical protein C0403_03185 [Desulfobacterium sp.]|nr:hypothetical protein [Desulfobacterium sp.]